VTLNEVREAFELGRIEVIPHPRQTGSGKSPTVSIQESDGSPPGRFAYLSLVLVSEGE